MLIHESCFFSIEPYLLFDLVLPRWLTRYPHSFLDLTRMSLYYRFRLSKLSESEIKIFNSAWEITLYFFAVRKMNRIEVWNEN